MYKENAHQSTPGAGRQPKKDRCINPGLDGVLKKQVQNDLGHNIMQEYLDDDDPSPLL